MIHFLDPTRRFGRWGVVTIALVIVTTPLAVSAQPSGPSTNAPTAADTPSPTGTPFSVEAPEVLPTPAPTAAIVLPTTTPPSPATPAPTPTAAPPPSPSPTPTARPPATPSPAPPPPPSANPSANNQPNDAKVLYPASGWGKLVGAASPAKAAAADPSREPPSVTSLAFSFLALLCLCGFGLVVMRRRLGFGVPGVKGQRKLVVSETRPLGNRQFLIVVEYESQRVLLGVTPGKIDYLCELTPPVSAGSSEAGATPATKQDYGALIDKAKAQQTL